MLTEPLFSRLRRRYPRPHDVQLLLRSMPYNRERQGETLLSARHTYERRRAHCLEAALLAAAILEQPLWSDKDSKQLLHPGYPPLVMSLESVDDLDHVIFIFKEKTGWGSVARSREPGLHGRAPVFKTLKSLTESYHAPYVDQTGRLTGYGQAHLDQSGVNWRSGRGNLWTVEQYLIDLKHRPAPQSDREARRLKARYLTHGPLRSGPHWW